jgi:hypothetical protein
MLRGVRVLSRSLFEKSWLFVVSGLAILAAADIATACERCRLLGTAALHDPALEKSSDTVVAPSSSVAQGDGSPPAYADGNPNAYSLSGSYWPQPNPLNPSCGTRCLGTPITLTYSYENMFDGGILMPDGQPLPNLIIKQSIEEALGLWARVTPITFVEVPDDHLPYGSSTQHGTIRFRHIYINGPDPVIGAPIAKAQAYYPSTGLYAGDVEFDHMDRWQVNGTLKQPDILGATIHELGHSLGLNHTSYTQAGAFWTYQDYNGQGQVIDVNLPKGDANMYWVFNRRTGLGSGFLFQGDINGAQAIYGAGSGSVIPIGVPEPASWMILLTLINCLITARRRSNCDHLAI